ncbi:MAG TPA: hypothetical protein VGP93_00795, partial [Polyangiaceae bacterium]|nr:hypothetical protein [Polyangiaceae bacterium]
AGGEAKLLNEGLSAQGMGVAGGYIYISDFTSQSVKRLPTNGGAPENFGTPSADLPYLTALTVSDKAVYWVDKGNLETSTFSMPVTVSGLGKVEEGNLSVEGNRIYWQDDTVGYTSLDGSGCTTVVHGDFPANADEYGLTTNYVFVAGDSKLIRVPKN